MIGIELPEDFTCEVDSFEIKITQGFWIFTEFWMKWFALFFTFPNIFLCLSISTCLIAIRTDVIS